MKRITHLVAGTLAAAAFGSALLMTPALATPGSGFAPTTIVNGQFGEIDLQQEKVGTWDLLIKTKDDTDVGSDKLTVQPGGFSGWHAHPAPVLVTVTQGTIQWRDGGDPLCPWKTYTVGQSFIEPALRSHYVRNTTGSVAEFIAIRINPTGVPFRIDRSEPNNCSF